MIPPNASVTGTVSFPPGAWIHELNRLFPNLWADLRKARENPKRYMNDECVKFIGDVPAWCPMPTFFPYLTLAKRLGSNVYLRYRDVVMTIASLYLWRAGKGIYRFSPELYRALVSQPFSGDIPNECLYRMPEWAVYIETPGIVIGKLPVSGFIAHLDYNLYSRETDLQFAIFRHGVGEPKMIALPLGEGGLIEAMHRVDAIDSMFNIPRDRQIGLRDDYRQALSAMLQLLLYLCSEEPDMPAIEHPRNRRTLSGGVRSPESPQLWDVGVRIGAALRKAESVHSIGFLDGADSDGGSHSGHARPRAHIRSAHWTTYWTGPRTGKQTPILRWIPPLPINMDWKKATPAVVHPVTS